MIFVNYSFISVFFLQEQAVVVLNSTSLKENVFLDLRRKLNSTENDLRDVKDQVHNIIQVHIKGAEKKRERKSKEPGVKFPCSQNIV